ncbi:MAG: multiheme c-type cytochrome [Sphingomonadaceae bacterium]
MAVKPKGLLAMAVLLVLALGITAGTLLAAETQPQAGKPTAEIEIVPVTAKATDPNVLEGTLADGKTKAQFGTTGLDNAAIGVPVTLTGSATDPKVSVTKYAWTLTKPKASKAELSTNNEPTVKFTPDVSGVYKVDLVLSNEAGAGPMASVQIRAGEYIGTGLGNCFQCHPGTTQGWSETGHATMLKTAINSGDTHYTEGCIRCHSTGYTPGADNGGFTSVQQGTGWEFPSKEAMASDGDKWAEMPILLQNMANIQCESCHGPAKNHVEKGAKMASSMDDGICNQCHDTSAKHIKGTQIKAAKHSDEDSQAWNYPTGPSRQACVRCHSGAGYVSFVENPTEPASWDNSKQTVGCSTCHDPHSAANKFQLRTVGKPTEAAGVTKDFGLSATCANCHNGRTTAADAQKGSYPHYSPAAEMLSDTGGVTYGQTVPNSPHGMLVGTSPMRDPADAEGKTMLFGGATPGPCVACHMVGNSLDANDPNKFNVGEHSFNMVSPDGKAQNISACQSCHAGATKFDFEAKADYDGNGKVEGVQEEVAGLVRLLQQAIADSGIKPIEGNPYFDPQDLAKANEKQRNAIYNYRFVRGLEGSDGKANAIHNFKRSVALLQLSYKDLTGNDVPNATIIVK